MILVRLLAAGKSLVGLRDGASPYRVTRQRLLPRFGGGGSPFRDSTSTVAESNGEASEGAAPARRAVEAPAASKPAGMASASGNRLKHKLTSLLTPKRAKGQSMPLRLARAPMQCELSLDRVTVIRNDLRDADLEVVPRRSVVVPVPASAPSEKPVNMDGFHQRTLNRVSLRLFGAGKL